MKFYKNRLKFVLPLAISVGVASTIMLMNKYTEVPMTDRVMIIAGATILTAVIAYFLFPLDGEDRPDDRGPY